MERHGVLSVEGNRVVNERGEFAQLRGMSFFWSMWMDKYWNKDAVQWLADDWKVGIVRAAMGVDESGGYLNPADWLPDSKQFNKNLVETVVNASLDAGIYVIIDWHSHHAEEYLNESVAFFGEMAQRYGHHPNVLFELFNEPTTQDWTTVVKPYHEAVVSEIRKYSSNIVILGSPTWSQDVDVACADPVVGENIAYTLHFYATTHKQFLRDKAQSALNSNCALVVTEWGTCKATGNGTLDFDETQLWMDFMDANGISSTNWAVSDKYESCSALQPGASPSGGWINGLDNDLTWSGLRVRNYLNYGGPITCDGEGFPCVPPLCSDPNDECLSSRCCGDAAYACYQKDEGWAQCMQSCGGPGQEDWSCNVLTTTPPPVPWATAVSV